MTRLTEEMVAARSKQSDLSSIKKLNCWGAELTDVSILKRMANVEVLALSINKIRSLVDFQHCRRLKELYVRKNKVADLSEIRYLRSLPCLKVLWLGENPCAEHANYRMTVLRALPHLEKLDDVAVDEDEVEEAARKGTPIYDSDAEDQEDYEPELQSPHVTNIATFQDKINNQTWNNRCLESNGGDRNTETLRNNQQDERNQDSYETANAQTAFYRTSALRRTPPPSNRNDYENHSTPANHTFSSRHSALPRSPPNTNGTSYSQISPGRQRAYSPDPIEDNRYDQSVSRSQYFERSASIGDDLSETASQRQQILETVTTVVQQNNDNNNHEIVYRRSIQHSQSAHSIKEPSQLNGDHGRDRERYSSQQTSARHSMVSPHGDYYERQTDRYSSQILEAPSQSQYSSQQQQQQHRASVGGADTWERDSVMSSSRDNPQIASAVMADHKGFTRRPMTRNSNLLSALLCLVKELDYPSLEVAEMAVRCRMDELANRP